MSTPRVQHRDVVEIEQGEHAAQLLGFSSRSCCWHVESKRYEIGFVWELDNERYRRLTAALSPLYPHGGSWQGLARALPHTQTKTTNPKVLSFSKDWSPITTYHLDISTSSWRLLGLLIGSPTTG